MPILIDIGNSYLKITNINNDNFIEKIKLDIASKIQIIANLKKFLETDKQLKQKKILICSVNLEWNNVLKDFFTNYQSCWINIKDFSNLKFSSSSEIGLDLLLLGNAVNQHQSTLIISCGTATTFSLWDKTILKGVSIVLGAWSTYTSLLEKASLLDNKLEVSTSNLLILGNDTASAIGSGTFIGHALMIEAMINKIKSNFQVDNVILTGGGLKNVVDHFEKKHYIDEHLLFKGLAKIKNNYLNK